MTEPGQFCDIQVCKRTRLLVIHNPVAGRRRKRVLRRAIAALRLAGVEVVEHVSRCPGDGEARARAACSEEGLDGIVAAGGDGTLNEVVNGCAGSGIPIGLLPMGSANVFALEAGIPRHPEAWARMVLEGINRPIRLGRAGDRLFVAMVSAGFDSRAVATVNLGIKRRLGKLAYALSGCSALVTTRRDRLMVTIDGETAECGWVIVAKTRHFAGPFKLVSTASLERDDLGVAVFPVRGWAGRIRDLLLLGLGRGALIPGARMLTGHKVVLASQAPIMAQMDGDIFMEPPIALECGPAVPFMLPGAAVS
jgi:YegS/Rv2252/BmrU family lipid kinase